MSKKFATIKLKIKNGKGNASVSGTPTQIVEGIAMMLVESPELLKFFKASVEVAELSNQELNNN